MNSKLIEYCEFLDTLQIPLRLACKDESSWPVVLSLWYLHQGGKLYCATQGTAKVASYLRSDSRCGFEIAEDRPPYCGVRGRANAVIDERAGISVLEQLIERYLGGTNSFLAQKLLANSENEVAIILHPEWVTTWNFSSRMEGMSSTSPKICP